jgi:magnesium-transporting ATPase (P-type)
MIFAAVPHVFSHNFVKEKNTNNDINAQEDEEGNIVIEEISKTNIKNNEKKKKKKSYEFGHQVLRKVYYLIVTALSLVSALAWNSAFQNFFQNNKYLKHKGPWLYASFVSIITIGLIIGFTKLIEKVEKKKIKNI